MYMPCKNCKKHTGNTFPKKLVLISKNKIKGKSKCAICLTERTFIHEIEGKYDIKMNEIVNKFLLAGDSCQIHARIAF